VTHQKSLEARTARTVWCHSDGSLLEGCVGAGVLVQVVDGAGEVGESIRLRSLGDRQTVWAGEAEGAHLALSASLPVLLPFAITSLTLYINNQALLLSPFSPSPSPGQQQQLRLRSLVTHIQQHTPDLAITFTWSPGHLDIDGDERADELAKRGAELGIEREKATRVRFERRTAMKSKRTGQAKVFRVGMEEWEESDDEEWGAGGVLERSETLASRMQLMASAALSGPEEQVVSQEWEVVGGEKLPKLLNALKQVWWEEEKREWEKMWKRSSVGAGLRSIDPCQPGPSFNKHLHSLAATPPSSLAFDSTSTTWAQPNGFSTLPQRSGCVSAGRGRRGSISCSSARGMRDRGGSSGGDGAGGVDGAVGVSSPVYFPPPSFYPFQRAFSALFLSFRYPLTLLAICCLVSEFADST
jgi:hypothetical protein